MNFMIKQLRLFFYFAHAFPFILFYTTQLMVEKQHECVREYDIWFILFIIQKNGCKGDKAFFSFSFCLLLDIRFLFLNLLLTLDLFRGLLCELFFILLLLFSLYRRAMWMSCCFASILYSRSLILSYCEKKQSHVANMYLNVVSSGNFHSTFFIIIFISPKVSFPQHQLLISLRIYTSCMGNFFIIHTLNTITVQY